jgi:phosphoglycolate phosphatase
LKQIGKTEKDFTDEQIKDSIGPSKVEAFKTHFHLTETEAVTASNIYYSWYLEKGIEKCYLVDNVLETLKCLKEKNYILSVVTLKPQIFAEKILHNLHISKFFTVLVGASLSNVHSGKRELIINAQQLLNADSSQCLLIGDRKEDVESATFLKMDAALFLQGYASKQEIQTLQVKYKFKNFLDLISLIE